MTTSREEFFRAVEEGDNEAFLQLMKQHVREITDTFIVLWPWSFINTLCKGSP